MKKLNLQLGSIKEMLSKEQMKKIDGGYHSCPWPGDFPCKCPDGFVVCASTIQDCINKCGA